MAPIPDTVTIGFKNLTTGQIRFETRTKVEAQNISTVWQSSYDGRYYTHGVIGWYDVTEIVKLKQ